MQLSLAWREPDPGAQPIDEFDGIKQSGPLTARGGSRRRPRLAPLAATAARMRGTDCRRVSKLLRVNGQNALRGFMARQDLLSKRDFISERLPEIRQERQRLKAGRHTESHRTSDTDKADA
jgi:hypothetical protein